MRIYVDELPKCCLECQLECPYEDRCVDTITMNCSECIGRPKDCPLHSLSDYTKQVRKEVCNDFKSRFLATCQIEKVCDTASFSLEVLNKILDQLQEDKQ